MLKTGDLASELKGYNDEEDEEDEDAIAVQSNDGQQYVVLEVIHLADSQENEQVIKFQQNKFFNITKIKNNNAKLY